MQSSSSSWWSAPDPNQQQQQQYAASPPAASAGQQQYFTHPALMDDTMDEPAVAPNHLPGYLTATLRGSPKGVHSPEVSHQSPHRFAQDVRSNQGGNGEPWLSSSAGSYGTPGRSNSGGGGGGYGSFGAGPGGLPSPPASRFGTGGLFDRSPTMSMALTVSQLDQQRGGGRQQGQDEDEEWGPPVVSLEDGQQGGQDMAWEANVSSGAKEVYPTSSLSVNPSTSPTSATQVILFGPPPSLHPSLISHFSTLGPITSSFSDPSGGNWLTVTFATELDARRAISRNGEILGGSWMVGVKWADPFFSTTSTNPNRPSPTPQAAQLSTSPQTHFSASSSTPGRSNPVGAGGKVGTPVKLAPSSSAFRRLQPAQPTASSSSFSSKGRDQSLVDAAKGTSGQPNAGGGGVLGKLGELVFGF